MSFGGFFWGYRQDLVDIEIKDIRDLLHPSLKGKICGIPPEMHVGLTTSSLAMGLGGDEYNQEAGWDFMKELAAAGQFGRIAYSDVDIINSINIGETAVSFQGTANWNELKKNHPVARLTKVPGSKGMKTFFYSEAFVIFKGPRQDDAIKVVNNFPLAGEEWRVQRRHRPATGQRQVAGAGQRGGRRLHRGRDQGVRRLSRLPAPRRDPRSRRRSLGEGNHTPDPQRVTRRSMRKRPRRLSFFETAAFFSIRIT